jgi:hypothetical protein
MELTDSGGGNVSFNMSLKTLERINNKLILLSNYWELKQAMGETFWNEIVNTLIEIYKEIRPAIDKEALRKEGDAMYLYLISHPVRNNDGGVGIERGTELVAAEFDFWIKDMLWSGGITMQKSQDPGEAILE